VKSHVVLRPADRRGRHDCKVDLRDGRRQMPSDGMQGWIGSARPQMSRDGVNVLPEAGSRLGAPR
jgi:hypothetical protein